MSALNNASPDYYRGVISINDSGTRERAHKQVLSLYDRAIKLAKKRERREKEYASKASN